MSSVGIFPIQTNPKSILEKLKLFINLIFQILYLVETLCTYYYCIEHGGGIHYLFSSIYLTLSQIISINLLTIACRWSKLSKIWLEKEKKFRKFPYRKLKQNYKLLMTGCTVMSVILTFYFHITWIISRKADAEAEFERCLAENERSTSIYSYLLVGKPHIFYVFKFRSWMGPIVQALHLFSDFCWLLGHNFTVLFSLWISARFKQLYERIQCEIKVKSQECWHEIYQDYKTLVEILELVDKEIGVFIIITCMIWLFFLCFFVFHLIR